MFNVVNIHSRQQVGVLPFTLHPNDYYRKEYFLAYNVMKNVPYDAI